VEFSNIRCIVWGGGSIFRNSLSESMRELGPSTMLTGKNRFCCHRGRRARSDGTQKVIGSRARKRHREKKSLLARTDSLLPNVVEYANHEFISTKSDV